MIGRRSVYFAFQGLLTAVLLAMFALGARGFKGGGLELLGLTVLLALPLVVMQLAADETLGQWWFQTGFFMADAAAATIALYWRQPVPAAYMVYFLIIFGTAMTRSFKQSLVVGVVSCGLYLLIYSHGPRDADFWLRFQLLIITTTLLSLLSRDAQASQRAQELRHQGQLIQAERLATLGRVAAEVAHRIKGPLTTIRVNAEVLTHKFAKNKEALKELAEIEQEVEHCKSILKGLLDLGRIEEMDLAPLDLREPIENAVRAIGTQMKRRGLELEIHGLDGTLPIVGDRSLLQEALGALLQNAVEASADGGRVVVRVERPGPRRGLRVSVQDDGRGIAAADLERVFQPFFTTKGTEGSGLGLSAALRIVQKHDGSIEAYSDGPGKGARFTLALPRVLIIALLVLGLSSPLRAEPPAAVPVRASAVAVNPSCDVRGYQVGGACTPDSRTQFCGSVAGCEKYCCCAFAFDPAKWAGEYDWATTNVSAPVDIPGTQRPDSKELVDLGKTLHDIKVLVGYKGKIATQGAAAGLQRLDAVLLDLRDASAYKNQPFTVAVGSCYRRAIGNSIKPLSPAGPDGNAEAVCGHLFLKMFFEDMPKRTEKQDHVLKALTNGAPSAFMMAWPGYTPHAEGVACDLILRDEKGQDCFNAVAGVAGSPKCAIDQQTAVALLTHAVADAGGSRLDFEAWHFEWGGRSGKGSCRCAGAGCDSIWPITTSVGCPD
jgi:signal transduction histidine kinase